jgi:hypothetical protein
MVLTLIEKLKADHGIALPSRTPSECALTEPKDVMSEASIVSASDATSTVATSGGGGSSILSRSRKDSEENDQQVDDTRKRKKVIRTSKKGKKTTDVQIERVGPPAEVEPAVSSLDATPSPRPYTTDATPSTPPMSAPTRRPSLLFRNFSKSAVGAAPEAASAPPSAGQVDIGALGGATLVICCESDKWDCGKLGPVSYDKVVQLILERCDTVLFHECVSVCVVCCARVPCVVLRESSGVDLVVCDQPTGTGTSSPRRARWASCVRGSRRRA